MHWDEIWYYKAKIEENRDPKLESQELDAIL